jgi:hypothetical protein
MNRRSLNLLAMWSLLVFLLILVVIFRLNKWNGKDDFRIGIYGDKKIALLNISPDRKMINFWEISDEVELWIPKGLSWYKVDKIKSILEEENKKELAGDILFYNFGFLTDKIVWKKDINFWKNDWNLFNYLGVVGWINYRLGINDWLVKTETYEGNIIEDNSIIREWAFRDLADNKIINGEVKLSIINTTSRNGLGGFIGSLLEFAGFSVVSIDSISEDIDKCRFVYGKEVKDSCEFSVISKIWNCKNILDESLDEWNAELYFGEEEALMLKYSNYVRSQ